MVSSLVRNVSFMILFSSTTLMAADSTSWNQWRGPSRTGFYLGELFPSNLSKDSLKLSWKVSLGPSYSGPVVSDQFVFTTETKNKEFEVAHAYDRKTGKEIWSTEWKGSMSVPFFAGSNGSWIRSTPAFDGENLFVAGMKDLLVCLDAKNGKEKWRIDFVEQFKTPVPSFGFVSSPLVDGNVLYVQAGASVFKLDKKNGSVIWRSMKDSGGMNGSAFSSPFVCEIAGQKQLLVQTREKLAGLNPDTGEAIWSKTVPSFRGMNIFTPVVSGDNIFASTYQNKSWLYSVKKGDNGFSVNDVWENKLQGYMSTPVIINGFAYMHLQNQRFSCIDLSSGETKWTSSKSFGKYWSLVAHKNRILALDQKGILYLIEADPKELKILDTREIAESESWAHLAISGDQIFIRDLKNLSVYQFQN